ncbi:MAG: Coq4 family protein [Aequoribacter sp.]|uniref:Coq4 family protein n=1 Tax=Aequoribacter sp. TaxID=2847771 RepID=UPI003C3EF112
MAAKTTIKEALQALRRLLRDPEATDEVFTVIRGFSGNSFEKEFQRFVRSESGQQILANKQELLDVLKSDFSQYPTNSLGGTYSRFLRLEGLSADGLVDASDPTQEVFDEPMRAKFGRRQRDQHDLWHTVTQYGRDELGELCLLAFTYAQTGNRGIGLIVFFGALKYRKLIGNKVFQAIREGYRNGKRCAWLPGAVWEELLALPVEEVRQKLKLPEPTTYWACRGGERFASLQPL